VNTEFLKFTFNKATADSAFAQSDFWRQSEGLRISTRMANNPSAHEQERDSDHTLHDQDGGNNNDHDGEKGKENKEPKPVGFWDKSLNKVRMTVFKKWAITGTILASSQVASN
jgi:hypothetical protein